MINIGNEKAMIIGGYTGFDNSAQTYIYNHNHGNWSNGPSLIQERALHAAGIVTDEATDEKLYIVTGGDILDMDPEQIYASKSTEILRRESWFSGKKML